MPSMTPLGRVAGDFNPFPLFASDFKRQSFGDNNFIDFSAPSTVSGPPTFYMVAPHLYVVSPLFVLNKRKRLQRGCAAWVFELGDRLLSVLLPPVS